MDKITYVINFHGKDPRVPLLCKSIRHHAGSFSEYPIWILTPEGTKISESISEALDTLNTEFLNYPLDPDKKKFPFADIVHAAAAAESLAEGSTELLAWLTVDSLFIHEPGDFLLEKSYNLGYRPVHHTLVGSIYSEPLDHFWELVYSKCGVSDDRVFPMKTHVDGNTLRPYFNAGFMITRPETGLLQSWRDNFDNHYRDPGFLDFYEKNNLYAIFIHQAILSGTILAKMGQQELLELPFGYNYPLHLHAESPGFQPGSVDDLIMVRYENPKHLKEFSFRDAYQSWLDSELKDFPWEVFK